MRLLGSNVQFVDLGTATRVEIRTTAECRASGSDCPQMQTARFLSADLPTTWGQAPTRSKTETRDRLFGSAGLSAYSVV